MEHLILCWILLVCRILQHQLGYIQCTKILIFIELEEEQHGGTSRVKKKEWKIKGKSTCQRSKEKQIEVTDVR